MRLTILAICIPTFAGAWEFSPSPLCTLTHQSDRTRVQITHDPSIAEYRMVVTLRTGSWAPSKSFGIAFQGGRPLTIGTDRHEIDDSTLTVADTGFSNVLKGLEFNQLAIAFTTSQSLELNLTGAAPEVRKFRSCALQGPPMTTHVPAARSMAAIA